MKIRVSGNCAFPHILLPFSFKSLSILRRLLVNAYNAVLQPFDSGMQHVVMGCKELSLGAFNRGLFLDPLTSPFLHPFAQTYEASL